jgi:hypothetical protein
MDPIKFSKILSLAASDNEAEALRALQAAKRMLEAAGLDFVDVANLVVAPDETDDSELIADLRQRVARLRQENRQLKGENRRLRGSSPTPASELTARIEAERLAALNEATRLAAEIRRLTLVTTHLNSELERTEQHGYRLVAEARKDALTQANRPAPHRRLARTLEGQYRLL